VSNGDKYKALPFAQLLSRVQQGRQAWGVLGRSAEAIEVDGEVVVARYGVLLLIDEIDRRRVRRGR
jgi:hypothetical protein